MKKVKNLVIALFLAFTFIVADLVAAPVTAQAAGSLKFAKSITLMKGEGSYGIINSVKSDKILNLKSSNTSVVKVKKDPFDGNMYSLTIKGTKQGTATVSFTVQRKNGKKYFFKSKVSVFNYTNPLSKCTFGKTDYSKQFDKQKNYFVSFNTAKKGKINVTVKKGYKLKGLYFCEYGTGARKKIKNGSTITLDSSHYLEIDYKNTSKNYSYTMILGGTI